MKQIEMIIEVIGRILQISEPVLLKAFLFVILILEAIRFFMWVLGT